jgi:hypothetical protein
MPIEPLLAASTSIVTRSSAAAAPHELESAQIFASPALSIGRLGA